MKCWHCDAQNPKRSATCWACGIQLNRSARRAPSFQPEAMRHYTSASVALEQHRTWLDGLVLLSTILFGILLGHFVANVLPSSSPLDRWNAMLASGPLGFINPNVRALPMRNVGEAQELNGVVTQVAQVRRAKNEAGREAPAGQQMLTATVVVDNQGARPLAYNLNDWKVRDSRGRTVTPQAISAQGWLSSGRIEPGQKVQGAVSFAIPESEAAPQITFSPSALGALLRWDATAR
ncbi:MAG TPA: DUF4352 domain-containing protein [Chloroflexota bacterium]|nr:DUF4352 domain-containing protein [Chloroflexota bacterium]